MVIELPFREPEVEQLFDVRDVAPHQRGHDAEGEARIPRANLLQRLHRRERLFVIAGDAAHAVVRFADAVERNRDIDAKSAPGWPGSH